ncbi:MAG: DUF3859 domain-containing protein [Salaquimonas sp.]|jgi:hypothetical protein|nr:DUF3859 domain-containing protein [Salaquimonas sp.]
MPKSVLAFLLVFPFFTAIAPAASLEGVDVVDAGIYRVDTGAESAEPGTPTGEVTAVVKATLLEATDTVPARLGTEFGFRYEVVGKPAGEAVMLDFVITYPDKGLHDPASGRTLHESRYSKAKPIASTEYFGYGLENDWEAVPGTWTFEIWQDGVKFAGRSFTLTK